MGSAQSRRRGNRSPPSSSTLLLIEADACSTDLTFDSTEEHLARAATDPLAPLRALCVETSPKVERKHEVRTGRRNLCGTVEVVDDDLDTLMAAINACSPLDSLAITIKSSPGFANADACIAALIDRLDVQLRKLTFENRTETLADLLLTAQALVRLFQRPCSAALEDIRLKGSTTGRPAERNMARLAATLDKSWTSRATHDIVVEIKGDYTRAFQPGYDWAEHNRKHEELVAENSPRSIYVLTSSRPHAKVRAAALRALVTATVLLHAQAGAHGDSPFVALPAEIIHRILAYADDTLTRPQAATVLRYAEDRAALARVVREWNRLDPRQSWDAVAERRDRRSEWLYNGGFSLSHREVCAMRPHHSG